MSKKNHVLDVVKFSEKINENILGLNLRVFRAFASLLSLVPKPQNLIASVICEKSVRPTSVSQIFFSHLEVICVVYWSNLNVCNVMFHIFVFRYALNIATK